LYHQNNYVKLVARILKFSAALLIIFQQNYFDGPTKKLFSDLYPAKFQISKIVLSVHKK